ncbi:hypothetical protein C0J52_04415 [Blattella germanica]|nr:hypothetical protein C0J52_04415 [Blattella germanica]
MSKERLTVFICANMDGEIEIPIVIGKAACRRPFRHLDHTTLPVHWHFNKKTWMTNIGVENLREIKELCMQGNLPVEAEDSELATTQDIQSASDITMGGNVSESDDDEGEETVRTFREVTLRNLQLLRMFRINAGRKRDFTAFSSTKVTTVYFERTVGVKNYVSTVIKK